MTNTLELRPEQRTVLAPQMQQGVRLLEMSWPELKAELDAEVLRNPVIESVDYPKEKTSAESVAPKTSGEAEPETYIGDDDNALDKATLEGFDRDGDYVIGETGGYQGAPSDAQEDDRRQKLIDSQVWHETLEHHLLAQVRCLNLSKREQQLAEILLGELNEDGRFVGSMPDIIMVTGESEVTIRALLAKIRLLDPPGCGATTLAECLAAQLDEISDLGLRARVASLLGHLEDVAKGQVDDPEALAALRTLNPRPGRAFGDSASSKEVIYPEVHLVRGTDGKWEAVTDQSMLPELKISSRYEKMLNDPHVANDVKAYIRERMDAVNALNKSIRGRGETIQRTVQAIIDRQPGFFEKGLKGVTPMTQGEIAKAVGRDVSTISRTVNGKYVSTPRGVVELSRFFTKGVATASGEIVSRDSVLDKLREIVEGEDKANPLSDDQLAESLQRMGVAKVARRTVAKYRALADIPSSTERREI